MAMYPDHSHMRVSWETRYKLCICAIRKQMSWAEVSARVGVSTQALKIATMTQLMRFPADNREQIAQFLEDQSR